MVEAGCDCVVMEVSSQGLMLHRTQGFVFDFGIFTNIEPDHIGPNEHKDFDHYLACKSMLLKQCRTLETYGFSPEADLRAEDAKLVGGKGYLGISYHLKGLMDFPVEIDIPGKFSIYNSLTAIAICRHFKVSQENILKALKVAKVKVYPDDRLCTQCNGSREPSYHPSGVPSPQTGMPVWMWRQSFQASPLRNG